MSLRSLNILRELEKIQYLPREELEDLQAMRLRTMIRHTYDNVKYYRDLFEGAGITPDDIRDTGDLSRIPITTKEALQKTPLQDLLSAGIREEECVAKHTSGSTGKPLMFLFSESERDFQSLINLRILRSAGFRLTDKTAYLINPRRFPSNKIWFQNFGILRRYYLSVFDTPEIHLAALKRNKPDIIYGYPSNLTLLAHLIREKGDSDIRPKAVFSSAEALEPKPRALIASAMNTDVYDILGLVEIGDIAWECSAHEGYHMNSDVVIMEFLDDNDKPVGPGQTGRLVCTRLYGTAMPLIRYEVGDLCEPEDRHCSCGRTIPLMKSIKGRANDFIMLPDGKIIASCFLVIIMQEFHDIAQYRIIQTDERTLVIQLVKGMGFNERTPDLIKKEIEQITHKNLLIEIDILKELPRDESGKIRTVISRVIPDFQSNIQT